MMQLAAVGLALAGLSHHPVVSAPARPAIQHAGASWYSDESGRCASPAGCSYYGVANRTLRFGTRVEFFYRSRRVRGIVDDRGPFVYSRLWDLNEHVAAALGFSGVGTVGYRLG